MELAGYRSLPIKHFGFLTGNQQVTDELPRYGNCVTFTCPQRELAPTGTGKHCSIGKIQFTFLKILANILNRLLCDYNIVLAYS